MSNHENSELERLKALYSYDILDSMNEKEYDDLTSLAAQICGTPVALVSLIDSERQWFKSAHGLTIRETSRDTAICSTAIENKHETLIVKDARLDERFSNYAVVQGELNVVFYAGVPLVDHDDHALGTLCVIDHVERQLTDEQIKGLQTLASNVVNRIELRKLNEKLIQEKHHIIEALELNSSFYLVLNLDQTIEKIGSNFFKVIPQLKKGVNFDHYFHFDGQFSLNKFITENQTEYTKLLFMRVHELHQRYKCSMKRVDDRIILVASPVINSQFSLKDYNLTINDFAQHDYIAEYLFLQQTTSRSLDDSRKLTEKLVERNRLLEEAQKDIDALSRFPQENPNAILRFDFEHNLLYCNDASKVHFLDDFNIGNSDSMDASFVELLKAAVQKEPTNDSGVLSRNNRHYSITTKGIIENGYINVYVKDITRYVNEVTKKEQELSQLKDEVIEQKNFYEFILNNIPADIGVFSHDHKYLFVNPQGIKNPEIREFMIGKDDFDYCRFKGIPDNIARERREIFNRIIETKQLLSWEDEITTPEGKRVVVLREMAPLFDEKGDVKYVVGYGVHITDRKKAEEELKRANERMTLLQSFLNKTSDAIQVADAQGNIIYLNNVASKRHGIPIDSVSEYHVRDFESIFNEPGSWEAHFNELITLGSMQMQTTNFNHETGEEINVEVSIKHEIIDEKDYIIAASRDISERKRAEEKELRRNELLMERQKALVELSQLPSQLSVNERLGTILQTDAKIVSVSRVGFWYLTDDEKEVKCDLLFDLTSNSFLSGLSYPATEFHDYFEQMLLNDGMIVATDAFTHPATRQLKESYLEPLDIRSILDIPVRIGERILGVISHEHIGSNRVWHEDEITFARSIADLAALAIENSEKAKAEKALYLKSVFQKLLMEISTEYINLPVKDVDSAIHSSLARIGEFVHVDRVYIFDYNHIDKSCSCTFEWCADDITAEIENLQNIPYEKLPIWYDAHNFGELYSVPNVLELTDEKTKEILSAQGIQSMIAIPLMEGQTAHGFVGFDTVRSTREFSEDERSLLELYAQMLVNVNLRVSQWREIETSKQAIEQINHDLEAIVLEKTKANLQLAKSITDQEKLVTLGEISSGIAHDLNTPLGAIKSGAESVRFTLEKLFKGDIWKCTEEQINDACNKAMSLNQDLFIGGLQQMRETKAMESILLERYADRLGNINVNDLSQALVRARIESTEIDFLDRIIHTENRMDYLEVIFQMKTIRTLVDTILKSSDRAARVVQDLKSFIKEQKSSKRATIDLQKNISTVLNIFSFELNRIANVEFTIGDNCIIEGYDIKLFQLWSNLIKNALEAMEENNDRGLLRIYEERDESSITVVVENNGPKIPDEIQTEIFTKFYTTKSAKNGTGLGLNIVRNIVQEHNASIELNSTDEYTQFKIKFSL